MKHFTLITFLFVVNILLSQNVVDVKEIQGIWIAEDFYNSFEKTRNIHQSKDAFDPNYPVALRINPKEILNDKLYIGYEALHDHLLRAEKSEYIVTKKDTIGKKGCFEINISKRDSLNYFLTSEILYFNHDLKSYLTWDKNTVSLYRPKKGDSNSETIKYVRITNKFDRKYEYPNPLYYYTRSRVLGGSYVLKDYNSEKVLTKSLKFKPYGIVTGYPRFKNMYAYYSTDIFCGLPTEDEHIMLFDDVTKEDAKSIHFVLKRPSSNKIFLYEMYPRRYEYGQEEKKELGNPKYVLIKK